MSSTTEHERLPFLDSMRGIAAVVVVLSHCWYLAPTEVFKSANVGVANALHSFAGFFIYTLSKLSESGRASVILFFVLSGFVLATSLEKTPTSYLGYLTKRFFRIYPTFLVVILISYCLHSVIGAPYGVQSAWLKGIVDPTVSLHVLAEHLMMKGTDESIGLDGVIWSLEHELRISIIFPLILLMLKRFRAASMLSFLFISLSATIYTLDHTGSIIDGVAAETFRLSLVDSVFFIVFFAAGALLALSRKVVTKKIAHAPRAIQAGLGMLSFYCLLKTGYNSHSFVGCFNDIIRGVGAVGLISLTLGVKEISNGLCHAFFVWLGRISYSLYLVHVPILYVINQTIGSNWPVMVTATVLIAVALPVAELTARYVEFPCIRLGKIAAQKVASFLRLARAEPVMPPVSA